MDALSTLLIACATFVGTHALLSHPLRGALVRWIGPGPFQGLYSLVALVSFGWIILAYRAVPATAPAYVPGDATWIIASALMWAASVLFVGSFAGNPALPAPGASNIARREPRGVMGITRHPMMWSIALWAIVHILIWPTPENRILAIAILLLALGGSLGQDLKKSRLMGDAWRGWQRKTSFVPFMGQVSGRVPWRSAWPGVIAITAGTAFWLLLTWLHTPFGGRMAAGVWRWWS